MDKFRRGSGCGPLIVGTVFVAAGLHENIGPLIILGIVIVATTLFVQLRDVIAE